MMSEFEEFLKASRYNTWDHVREKRKKIEMQKFPALDYMEEGWQLLSDLNDGILKRDDDERMAGSPLGAFLYCVDLGFYPPPEILLAIQDCFEFYFDSNGKYDLEDIFFNCDKKKGIGNYSAQQAQGWLYQQLYMCEQGERRKSVIDSSYKKKPLADSAESLFDLFNIDDVTDVDNFLRGYRRWKKRNGIIKKNHK
jgi:hypothetical protein